jgi:hypothetical protein
MGLKALSAIKSNKLVAHNSKESEDSLDYASNHMFPVVYTLYTPRSQEGGEPPNMATQIQSLMSLPALATVLLGKVHNLK